MVLSHSAGNVSTQLDAALEGASITTVPGVADTATARLAELHGFPMVMIPGSITALSLGALPDDGTLPSEELVAHVRRIAARSDLALIVDIDNGYGDCASCADLGRSLRAAGAAAVIIEDGVANGPGGQSELFEPEHLEEKIRVLKEIFGELGPRVVARTNARASHSLVECASRLERYRAAGADGVFLFRPQEPSELEEIHSRVGAPQIAVLPTGEGYSQETWELFERSGVKIALIPSLGYRAALGAFDAALQQIRERALAVEATDPISALRLREIVRRSGGD